MRILGISKVPRPSGYGDDDAYIVQIRLDEIVKVANKAGYRQDDDFKKQLLVGMDYRHGLSDHGRL